MQRILTVTAILLTLTCAHLSAQPVLMKANIPFDFYMGKTLLPAGAYTLTQNAYLLTIQTANKRRAVMAIVRPASFADTPPTGVVRFNRYGSTYFLTAIWSMARQRAFGVAPSAKEKEVARLWRSRESATVALK